MVEKTGEFGSWSRYKASLKRQIGVYKVIYNPNFVPRSAITEAQVKAKYREMIKGEEARAKVVALSLGDVQSVGVDSPNVAAVLKALRHGKDIAELASSKKMNSRELEFIEGQGIPALEQAVFAAKQGDVIGPLVVDNQVMVGRVVEMRA